MNFVTKICMFFNGNQSNTVDWWLIIKLTFPLWVAHIVLPQRYLKIISLFLTLQGFLWQKNQTRKYLFILVVHKSKKAFLLNKEQRADFYSSYFPFVILRERWEHFKDEGDNCSQYLSGRCDFDEQKKKSRFSSLLG